MSQGDKDIVLMKAVLLEDFDLQKIYLVATEIAKKDQCKFGGISLYELPTTPPSIADCMTFTLESSKVNDVVEDLLAGLGADRSKIRFAISPIQREPSSPMVAKAQQSRITAGAREYLLTNWGSPFIIVFFVLLIAAAIELSAGASEVANDLAVYGFYSLVLGVALQIACYVRYGESARKPEELPRAKRPPAKRGQNRRLAIVALAVIALLVVGSVYFVTSSGILRSSSSLSGCAGPRTDGTVFVDTLITASIEICGQSHVVDAGAGGGLTYAYHSGLVNFTAPSSVNGSQFEFWRVALNNSPPRVVNTTSLVLELASGLSAQDSQVIAYFATAPPPTRSSTAASTTSASSASFSSATTTSNSTYSSATSVSAVSSTTNSDSSASTVAPTTSSTTSSNTTSTTGEGCRGDDGSVFMSPNINGTVLLGICGEQVSVSGGEGGGLDYNYRAGAITLFAPPTMDGKTFQFWLILLPSGNEQITGNEVVVGLPAGYNANGAMIEVFYG